MIAVIEKLKGHPLFAHVTLVRSERSQIAALVSAVAARWGLPDSAHFSRLFRRTYGLPPAEYRQGCLAPHLTPAVQGTSAGWQRQAMPLRFWPPRLGRSAGPRPRALAPSGRRGTTATGTSAASLTLTGTTGKRCACSGQLAELGDIRTGTFTSADGTVFDQSGACPAAPARCLKGQASRTVAGAAGLS